MYEEDLPPFEVKPGEDFDQSYQRALWKARSQLRAGALIRFRKR